MTAEIAVVRKPKTGSFMSSKQIARAAVEGRLVTFRTTIDTVTGFVVNMDDYHWLVAIPLHNCVRLSMIHKGSAPVVDIAADATLDHLDPSRKDQITLIGQDFWRFCAQFYLGQTAPQKEI